MRKKFLNRPVYDELTMTYRFEDGSGVVPFEMKLDMELASEMRTTAGTNGIHVLATLWGWKERLAKLSGKRSIPTSYK